MPRILITGNGFDLHHKLPTTYKDFIKIVNYISRNHNTNFDDIYKNSDSYKGLKASFQDDIKFDQNNIDLISEIANKNILFNFFKNELEIDTWIDFENKIEYLLENIFYGIRAMRETISAVGPIHPTSIFSIKTKLKNNRIFASILSFLHIVQIQNEGFTINEQFLIKKYGFYVDFDEDKIIDEIYSQLIEFRKLFNLYLQTFVVVLYRKYNTTDHLSHIFKNINYYFTFNYTPTFEELYNIKDISVNYLHGKSQSQKENIVFGISELFNEECHKSEYIKFTKYFQKFNNRTDFYFLNQLTKSSSENYIFYFWGHSLDRSDASYINEVFDFIDNIDSKIKRIVIIYHNESSRTKSLLNLFNIRSKEDMEIKIRNKILVFLQNNSDELKIDLNENIINPPLKIVF